MSQLEIESTDKKVAVEQDKLAQKQQDDLKMMFTLGLCVIYCLAMTITCGVFAFDYK